MGFSIHAGSIARWYEELCRIIHRRISDIVASNSRNLKPRSLPHEGGVYVFWWTGDTRLLSGEECNRNLELAGPAGRSVHLYLDDEWLGVATKLPIPLYVGKSADDISGRVGQHLRLSYTRMLPIGRGARRAARPTTTCQLRAGVEHLFPSEADTRTLILQNVGLSYVVLSGDQHAANRFYLEDLAVGLLRPPLNVDVER